MQLSYNYRSKLLEIVKQARRDLWEEIHIIDRKFEVKDTTMINDKRDYWMEQQSEAYNRMAQLDAIIYQINESL
jgi:hypothetical protein